MVYHWVPSKRKLLTAFSADSFCCDTSVDGHGGRLEKGCSHLIQDSEEQGVHRGSSPAWTQLFQSCLTSEAYSARSAFLPSPFFHSCKTYIIIWILSAVLSFCLTCLQISSYVHWLRTSVRKWEHFPKQSNALAPLGSWALRFTEHFLDLSLFSYRFLLLDYKLLLRNCLLYSLYFSSPLLVLFKGHWLLLNKGREWR